MGNNSSDYHSWRSEIYDESDKILFDEITKCIDVGALRSASVMICVSFTESLYKKLETLSEGNNKIKQDLSNYKSQDKDFLLVQYAKDYDLINELEYNHLNTIMDARNNYAHPNFESPTETQVISYLYFAVKYVLSRPHYYSFLYAKSLIEDHLIKDQFYWEGKSNIQIRNYANNFFKRLDRNSFKAVLKLLFESLEKLYDNIGENNVKCIDYCLIYLNELLSFDEALLSEEEVNDYLDRYQHTACHIFAHGDNWHKLDSRSRLRIFNYSLDFENGIFSQIEFINIFYPFYESDLLDENCKSKFKDILDEVSLEILLNCELDSKIYFDKIITYFKSYSWGYQNNAMKELYKIDLDIFTDLELVELGRNILQSADGNAWDCMDLIDNYYDEINTKFHDENLLQGMVNEVFVNDDNYFRYKVRCGRRILLILNQCPNEDIFNNLLKNIELSKPKNGDFIKFAQAKYYLSRLKDKNEAISLEIELIISSINKAICNSLNELFDDDYKQILTYRNYRYLAPHIYRCLNETKRGTFSKLAYEEPLDFIRFFSKVKPFVVNDENKPETIKWDLLEEFINPIDILKYVKEIELDELSITDKPLINEFLNRFD